LNSHPTFSNGNAVGKMHNLGVETLLFIKIFFIFTLKKLRKSTLIIETDNLSEYFLSEKET